MLTHHPFPDQCITNNVRLKSCEACRLSNRKCDRKEVCSRCSKKKISCVYSKNSTRNKRYKELKSLHESDMDSLKNVNQYSATSTASSLTTSPAEQLLEEIAKDFEHVPLFHPPPHSTDRVATTAAQFPISYSQPLTPVTIPPRWAQIAANTPITPGTQPFSNIFPAPQMTVQAPYSVASLSPPALRKESIPPPTSLHSLDSVVTNPFDAVPFAGAGAPAIPPPPIQPPPQMGASINEVDTAILEWLATPIFPPLSDPSFPDSFP